MLCYKVFCARIFGSRGSYWTCRQIESDFLWNFSWNFSGDFHLKFSPGNQGAYEQNDHFHALEAMVMVRTATPILHWSRARCLTPCYGRKPVESRDRFWQHGTQHGDGERRRRGGRRTLAATGGGCDRDGEAGGAWRRRVVAATGGAAVTGRMAEEEGWRSHCRPNNTCSARWHECACARSTWKGQWARSALACERTWASLRQARAGEGGRGMR
jgi:hypothetical protein